MRALLLCWAVMPVFAACVENDREPEAHQLASNGARWAAGAMPEVAARRDQERAAALLAGQRFTPNGEEIGLEHGSNLATLALRATTCFQLNVSTSTFFIEATLDVTTYPYTIGGGRISGSICDAPNWVLTGGTIDGNLTISGTHVGTGPCAASTIDIIGAFGPPAGYAGTYGFHAANNMFSHRTLFLGDNVPCPRRRGRIARMLVM